MPSERKVYTFEPGGGFTQVEEAPIVSRESKNPTEVIDVDPPKVDDLPRPEPQPQPQPTPEPPQPEPTPTPSPTPEPPQPETEPTPSPTPEPQEPTPSPTPELDTESDDPEDVPPDSPPDDPEKQVPETDNFFVAAALRLKDQGVLPEDFELPDGVDDDQADQAIYEAYVETLKPQANKELLSEFQSEIQKRGWTEQTLTYASMLENGVRPEDISQIQDYKTLSSVDVSKMGDDDKSEYVRQMYVDRGWNEKEIKRAIDSADIDGELDNLVTEANGYFQVRDKEFENQQRQIAKANEDQKLKLLQYRQAVVSEIFNKRQLAGEEFTDDQLDVFEEALYTRSIPVQHDGQIYNLTPYEQFEAALNQDFALKLWAFKKWMFREQEAEQYKTQALKEAEEGRIVKWGKKTSKVKGAPNVERAEQREIITDRPVIQGSTTDGNSFVFEDGQFKPIPKVD